MSFASIVTIANGTTIRMCRFPKGTSTAQVDNIAQVLGSIIVEDGKCLKIEVDYTDCNDADVITHYDP